MEEDEDKNELLGWEVRMAYFKGGKNVRNRERCVSLAVLLSLWTCQRARV